MADQTSARPIDCANDAAAYVTQARAVADTIIDIVGLEGEHLNLLYAVRSLLDVAFNRLADAREVADG
jgi:hypothetical protein